MVPIIGHRGDPGRCGSIHTQYRCEREAGHAGCHLATTGKDRAIRWGVVEVGCFDPYCVEGPDHGLPHRNGRGTSWWPGERVDEEPALFELEEV